jgi:hypothetical protein
VQDRASNHSYEKNDLAHVLDELDAAISLREPPFFELFKPVLDEELWPTASLCSVLKLDAQQGRNEVPPLLPMESMWHEELEIAPTMEDPSQKVEADLLAKLQRTVTTTQLYCDAFPATQKFLTNDHLTPSALPSLSGIAHTLPGLNPQVPSTIHQSKPINVSAKLVSFICDDANRTTTARVRPSCSRSILKRGTGGFSVALVPPLLTSHDEPRRSSLKQLMVPILVLTSSNSNND